MLSSLAWGQAQAQDTLWVRFDNRFKANVSMPIQNVDSIEVTPSKLRFYNATLPLGYSEKTISSFAPIDESEMSFVNPGRYLLKPSTYAGTDYTNAAATSGYIAKQLNLPIISPKLIEREHRVPQASLNRKQRMSNLKNSFTLHFDACGKNVLLLDDIATTGSTLNELSGCLKKKGANKVIAVVLSRRYKNG